MKQTRNLKKIISVLEKNGALLMTDSALPSVAGIIAGVPIKGSWWGHPAGNDIFNCTCELDDHPDVLSVKLLNGKVTFVHRSLWSALFGIVSREHPWQKKNLSDPAKKILKKIKSEGVVRTSDVVEFDSKTRSSAISELEKVLLVHSTQIHTESGSHERVLLKWQSVIDDRFKTGSLLSPDEGIREIEQCLERSQQRVRFPWSPAGRKSR